MSSNLSPTQAQFDPQQQETIALDDDAIQLQNLSKCYHIYETPRDRLKQFIMPKLRRLFRLTPRQYYREFWAVKDLSLRVKRGETIGIIGRNGSGKSTLLQMICGTLTPTRGQVNTEGRIAALLELGSGFNPEFTGRENVYLYASVLGLSHETIHARFDDIAAFADIGDYIEQPVKTYSSGMFVRLAFAVVAHVDADILVIDEALAVGDAIFIQKCMRFLRAFKQRGTLFFVSHDTHSVVNFCDRAIWLDRGIIMKNGSAKTVTEAYTKYCYQQDHGTDAPMVALEPSTVSPDSLPTTPTTSEQSQDGVITFLNNIPHSSGWKTGAAEITTITLTNTQGESVASFAGGEKITLRVKANIHKPLLSPILGFLLKDKLGQTLFGADTFNYTPKPIYTEQGECLEAQFTFILPFLPNGTYSLLAAIADGDHAKHIQHHWLNDAFLIHVSSAKIRHGLVGIPFETVSLHKAPVA